MMHASRKREARHPKKVLDALPFSMAEPAISGAHD